MNHPIVILDRDGVINHDSPHGIADPADWRPLDGSLEAIARLCRAGWSVVILTNQSGIARGRYDINALNRIHQKMLDALQPMGGEISAIFFCPHDDRDNCTCRKPKPGLFQELATRLPCHLPDAYAVGDSARDLQAAAAAHAKPVLVETGNGPDTRRALEDGSLKLPCEVPIYADLAAFADAVLETRAGG